MKRGTRAGRIYIFLGDDASEIELNDHGTNHTGDRLSQTLSLGNRVCLDLSAADVETILFVAERLKEAARKEQRFQRERAAAVAVMPLHERGPLDG